MIAPKSTCYTVAGKNYSVCSATQAYVIEYVYWSAGRPLRIGEAIDLVRGYVPHMLPANLSATVGKLVSRGLLAKLGHGVYVHKNLMDVLS